MFSPDTLSTVYGPKYLGCVLVFGNFFSLGIFVYIIISPLTIGFLKHVTNTCIDQGMKGSLIELELNELKSPFVNLMPICTQGWSGGGIGCSFFWGCGGNEAVC